MNNQPSFNPSIDMSTEKPARIDITEQDKENFLKSVLSDRSYEEAIPLFDGQLKVRFRSLTVQENTDVVNQIVADKKAGVAMDNDAYFITIATYRLGLALVSVDEKVYSDINKDTYLTVGDNDSYIVARAKSFKSWPTYKLSLFLDAFQKFEAKIIKLTNEVQTVNFWKASA
jgi:hypothetical protein